MLWHLACCFVALIGTSHGAGETDLTTGMLTAIYSLNHKFLDPPAALLVVGGGKSSVELVDLTDGGAESCISPVSALNYKSNAAGIWVDDNPTVCGGGDYYS